MTDLERSEVPFVDLGSCHAEIREQLDVAWGQVVACNAFVGGAAVALFETEFAAYCGASHCVGVGNGTDALELILTALGVGPGDEVVLPANTFVATPEAVTAVGAIPVFADVDPATLLLDPCSLSEVFTPATVAVIVVHLYGQVPDMDAISKVARRAGLVIIEDAAQAHGAEWDGRRAGSFGQAAAFSFYPTKNLGAFGDGGAVVTDDATLARRIRQLANHGRADDSHHCHSVIGRNSRLDGLQAAILSAKLKHLDRWNASRRQAAAWYRQNLGGTACRPLTIAPRATAVHHLEVVQVTERDEMMAALDAVQIHCGLHYPVPCHRQPAFARYCRGPLPIAEAAARQILSLPMFPSITAQQVGRVCDALVTAADASRGESGGS